MKHVPCALWQALPSDIENRLDACLDQAQAHLGSQEKILVFFRADDVGVPGAAFERLMDLFLSFEVPLALAVVPVWITTGRWQYMQRWVQKKTTLFCWHQHGWRHVNHEPEGKKQEFGPTRKAVRIIEELAQGRERLISIMGPAFTPIFTPPWNRCSATTLDALRQLDYRAVSRSWGSRPPSPPGLPDIAVNIDLHTRKEPTATDAWETLWEDIGQAIQQGRLGFMLHHQRMNDAAFEFLEVLLTWLKSHAAFAVCRMVDFT